MRILLFIAVLVASVSSFGQRFPMLPVANSPHGIFTLFEDSKSRLWLGTIDDVYCFDGVNFYSLRPYGFPREIPNAFSEDKAGGIWIGTQGPDVYGGKQAGGIYRYQGGHVEKVLSGDVLSLAAPGSGGMIAAMGTEVSNKPTYGDLYRLDLHQGRWTAELLTARFADHLSVDHEGNVLFPCPAGWCEFSRDQASNWHGGDFQRSIQQHPGDPLSERVLRDRYGCVWNRAEGRATYQCPGDAGPTTLPYLISQYDSSAHLEEAQDGSVLMLVPMILGRPGHFQAVGTEGLPPGIDTSMVARDGTIWIGSENGLFRFPYPFRLEFWSKAQGLRGMQIAPRRVGNRIYTAATNLVYLDDLRQKWVPIEGTSRFNQISDMLGLPGNRILISSVSGVGLYQAETGKLLASAETEEWSAGRLAQSNDGKIWMAENGVSRVQIDGKKITFHPEPVARNRVGELRSDSVRDILWACDGKQLIYRKGGIWHGLSQRDGLMDKACGSIDIDPAGDIWMTYERAGFAYISNPTSDHPQVKNIHNDLDNIAGDLAVNFLAHDIRGRVWMGNSHLNIATPDQAQNNHWLRLDEQEAGPAAAFEGAQGGLADTDGSLWFGANGGISHFSPPDDFLTHFPVPSISVAGFPIAGSPPQLADAVSRLPRQQEITAEVASMQFDRRSALHVRYRLLPDQKSWVDSTSMALHLGKLPWGAHTLQVQAQLGPGPWSDTAEQTISVLKPVWITWPALGGYCALGGSLFWSIRRWRRRRSERARKAFPELAEWRINALSPEIHELEGTLIDRRFEVGRILARGGFATVLEGRDLKQHGRPCAIKVFRQELANKDWMARRFAQEVLALSKIHHPNVVNIYGSGSLPNGNFYLVMEFISGVTLRELLELGKLSPQRVASLLRQAGSALDEIHAHGICHRDLKPENLMIRKSLDGEDEIVLIDFSIAIVKDPDVTMHGLSRAAGTIYYMAPEQAIGYAESSTDIYSLAKIVIEMLTGERLSVLLPDASMDLPQRVRELLAGLPLRLGSFSIEMLSSALEFDPARRPKQAGDFAAQIAQDLEMEAMLS